MTAHGVRVWSALIVLVASVAFAVSLPAMAQDTAAQLGAIRGTVWDADAAVPLGQVRVSIVELQLVVFTAPEGAFVFERVPPGEYTISFSRTGFDREVKSGVIVRPGQMQDVQVNLRIEVLEMDELVVTGADLLGDTEFGLLEIRQEAVVVQDAISKDLISKAGATDVAGALPLVVGASVTQGKYATVRGLSDRYTGTTLNSVRVPSADPRRRAVQVDLFPTGTVESVTVTKTFTPDLQGDFTGGGVDIKTKSIPDELVLSAAFAAEHNSLATGESDALTYEGGGVFGEDRSLPAGALIQPKSQYSLSNTNSWIRLNPTADQLQASNDWSQRTRAFSSVMGVSEDSPELNGSFSFTGGQAWNFGRDDVFGIIGSLTYKRSHDFYSDGRNNSAQFQFEGAPISVDERVDNRGVDELLLGGLLNVVWQSSEKHELALKTIANQAREDVARLQEEFLTAEVDQNQTLQYTERNLLSPQLHGRHEFANVVPGGIFENVELDWFLAANSTSQDEPDVRFFRNLFQPSTLTFFFPPGSATNQSRTQRIFRDLEEGSDQLTANVTLPFVQWTESEGRVKAGIYGERTDRDYTQKTFTYATVAQLNGPPPSGSPPPNLAYFCNLEAAQTQAFATDSEALWTDSFLDTERIGLAPRIPSCVYNAVAMHTTPAPNQLLWVITPLNTDVDYVGDQEVDAFYAMADLPLSPRLTLVAGARHERTKMSIVPSNVLNQVEAIVTLPDGTFAVAPNVDPADATADIDEKSWLPSVGAAYDLMTGMKLRGSWSRTIARPTFRELAPVATAEFLEGDEFTGNPDLTLADIENYDLRWEWFRASGDVFAASLFYKDLTDPIEYISFSATGRPFVQPQNFESGELRGFELEARVSLERFAEAARGLAVGANYTKLDSEVAVPGFLQEDLATYGLAEAERQLQGQPADLFNANVTYDHMERGWSIGLFFNRVGETLLTGSARGDDGAIPNVFEKATERLDFTLTKTAFERWAFTFKLKNITTPDRESVYRTPDGEETIKFFSETPLLVSLGAGWSW